MDIGKYVSRNCFSCQEWLYDRIFKECDGIDYLLNQEELKDHF